MGGWYDGGWTVNRRCDGRRPKSEDQERDNQDCWMCGTLNMSRRWSGGWWWNEACWLFNSLKLGRWWNGRSWVQQGCHKVLRIWTLISRVILKYWFSQTLKRLFLCLAGKKVLLYWFLGKNTRLLIWDLYTHPMQFYLQRELNQMQYKRLHLWNLKRG